MFNKYVTRVYFLDEVSDGVKERLRSSVRTIVADGKSVSL
jgi:hypothetical protein